MKILHVIPAMTWARGGPAMVVAALVRHQEAQGHQPTVLTTDQGARWGERPIELPASVETLRVRVWGPDRIAFAPRFSRLAATKLREVDIMHVHSIFRYPCFAAVKAARYADRPVIVRPCGVLHRYGLTGRSAWRKAMFLRRYGHMYRTVCDAWHYTSENERRQSWPFQQVPGFVVPNGIDSDIYAVDRIRARAAVQEQFPECGGSSYVLFLGRLHRKKRIDLLLESFLAAAPANLKLVIAGPDEQNLWPILKARYLQRESERRRVLRVGLVTGERKRQLLAGAVLFALPSEHENFGNSVLESLAAGTPVLGSDRVDLVNELAVEGLAHVAPLDLDAWKTRLQTLLMSSEVCDNFVQSTRRTISERYGWAGIAERISQEYVKTGSSL